MSKVRKIPRFSALELTTLLRRHGIRLRLRSGRLQVQGEVEDLPGDLRLEVDKRRTDLRDYLEVEIELHRAVQSVAHCWESLVEHERPWVDDHDLLDAIGECMRKDDVAGAREAIGQWRQAWAKAMCRGAAR